jgi:hypothetical protein
MAKTNKPGQQQRWAEAQRRCRLSDEAVRMAKELGLNPRSLIKNIPSPMQQWKAPVEDWVREIYQRRYGAKPGRRKAAARSDDGQRANSSGPSRSSAAGMPVPHPDGEQ